MPQSLSNPTDPKAYKIRNLWFNLHCVRFHLGEFLEIPGEVMFVLDTELALTRGQRLTLCFSDALGFALSRFLAGQFRPRRQNWGDSSASSVYWWCSSQQLMVLVSAAHDFPACFPAAQVDILLCLFCCSPFSQWSKTWFCLFCCSPFSQWSKTWFCLFCCSPFVSMDDDIILSLLLFAFLSMVEEILLSFFMFAFLSSVESCRH